MTMVKFMQISLEKKWKREAMRRINDENLRQTNFCFACASATADVTKKPGMANNEKLKQK